MRCRNVPCPEVKDAGRQTGAHDSSGKWIIQVIGAQHNMPLELLAEAMETANARGRKRHLQGYLKAAEDRHGQVQPKAGTSSALQDPGQCTLHHEAEALDITKRVAAGLMHQVP